MKNRTIYHLIVSQLALTLFVTAVLGLLFFFFSDLYPCFGSWVGIILLCLVVFAGCAAVSVLSLQRILGSLHNIADAVDSATKGVRDFELRIGDQPQLSGLVDAFSAMALNCFSAEDALAACDGRFESLYGCIPDAVWVADSLGNILELNDKACKLYGLSREELLGANSLALLPISARAEFARNFRGWFSQGAGGLDCCFYSAGGDCVPVQMNGAPLMFEDKRAVILIVRDISTQRQVEQTLDDAQQKADRLAQLQANFLANISHEIRTPMNAISGLSDLLESTELNDEQKEYVGLISGSCAHLVGVLTNVIDLSKLESGYVEIEKSPFSLPELISELCDAYRGRTESKGLGSIVDVADDLPSVLVGDQHRIAQVAGHLLDNAIKFTKQGSVTFRVAVVDERAVAGEYLIRFSIIDTGIGMSEELQRRMFNIFSQGDSSSTREYGGMGVGLALCRRVVEKMGGNLKLSSELGQGSTFSFVLPLGEK